jgi:hypothetical protein
MVFECAVITCLGGPFQCWKRIRNEILFDKFSKKYCRVRRDLSLIQRAQEFVRKLLRLSARKHANRTDDFRNQSSPNRSIPIDVIFPPQQLPNLIYLAA